MEITVKDPLTGEVFRTQAGRDVAYFMPRLIADLEKRLSEAGLSTADRQRLAESGHGPADLQKAFGAFCSFFATIPDVTCKTPRESADRSGFNAQPAVCRQLVLEKFALVCLGACWAGLKSSLFANEFPTFLEHLRARGLELADADHPSRSDADAQDPVSPSTAAGGAPA